jgi:hypothetical protein
VYRGPKGLEQSLILISDNARQLKWLTPPRLFDSIYKRFIKTHRSTLERAMLPWHMPLWLGGLELPQAEFLRGDSDTDFRIASHLVLAWNKLKLTPAKMIDTKTPWHIREYSLRKLNLPITTHLESQVDGEQVQAYRNLCNKATMDLMFNSDVSLEDIFDDPDSKKTPERNKRKRYVAASGAILKRNRKIWNAKKAKANFGPSVFSTRLPEEVFMHRKTYEAINVRFNKEDDYPVRGPDVVSAKTVTQEVTAAAFGWLEGPALPTAAERDEAAALTDDVGRVMLTYTPLRIAGSPRPRLGDIILDIA